MRLAYALIPVVLLTGTVIATPAEAKASRVEDAGAHRLSWNSRHKSFLRYAKRIVAKRPQQLSRAQNRKRLNLASAKPGLMRQQISKTPQVPLLIEAASNTGAPEVIVTPQPAISLVPQPATAATAQPEIATIPQPAIITTPQPAIIATQQPAIATTPQPAIIATPQPAIIATPKPAIIATPQPAIIAPRRMAKTLRSGPREIGRPFVLARLPVSQFRIKPNESTDPAYVLDIIRELAPSYGVPTWFALRIASVESGFDPYARGLAGEIGVYQLKCDSARLIGFTGDCYELTDARTNVRWGLKYLSLAIGSSDGDLHLAASKHNGGLGRASLVLSYIAKVF